MGTVERVGMCEHRQAWRCVQETEREEQVNRELSRCKPHFGTFSRVCEDWHAAVPEGWTRQGLGTGTTLLLPAGEAV